MSNSPGDVRVGAVGLALLASACLSTGEPLFTEDVVPPVASMAGAGTSPASSDPASSDPASSVSPSAAQEQPFGAVRDAALPPVPPGVPPGAGSAPVPPEPVQGAADVPAVQGDPCALDGLILCDSFEGSVPGVFPAADGWLPELTGCGSHSVDSAGPAFSGTSALRAEDGGYPECMLHADSSGEAEVFVRTRVYLGGGDELIGQYLSLIEFGTRPDQDDPELRVGVRPTNDTLCATPGLDVTGTGLSTGSLTDCTGLVLEPARWYCIEGHLSRNTTNLSLTISVDGAEVIARDFIGAEVWNSSELFVKVGRAAYGASGSGNVWHDDIAVSRLPTPCGP